MSKNTEQKDKNLNVGEVIARTESFVEKNQKIILIVVAAILVIVLGVFGISKFYFQPREVKATEEIFPAQHWFEVDSLDLALNGNATHLGFVEIANQYGSTKAGNTAKYYAGLCFLRKGEYQSALDYFNKYSPKDVITTQMVHVNTGDAYLELGNHSQAASAYEKAASVKANDMITPYALFKAGIAYEMQNNPTNALKAYNCIKTEFPYSSEARDIEKYIARLEVLSTK